MEKQHAIAHIGSRRLILTAMEAATILQIDHKTLIRWARKGYVPAHPMGEGRRRLWRFFEHELLTWIESQSGTLKSHDWSAA